MGSLAAIGYLLFWGYLMKLDPSKVQFRRWGFRIFNHLFVVFLFTATLWMPMCFAALDNNDASWLPWIQLALVITGFTAFLITFLLCKLNREARLSWHWAAVIGSSLLSVQCGILDAVIWPRFFHL